MGEFVEGLLGFGRFWVLALKKVMVMGDFWRQ